MLKETDKLILRELEASQPLTAYQLAKRLKKQETSISRRVKALVSINFITHQGQTSKGKLYITTQLAQTCILLWSDSKTQDASKISNHQNPYLEVKCEFATAPQNEEVRLR